MELQVIEQNAIVAAFSTENGIQTLFERMSEQARSIVPDVSTKKGRDAIASQAYKVSKSKTAVDNHGKELVAGIKAQASVIDRDRKAWRDQCDALRDEIRKPLDDWEQAEKDRVAKHEVSISVIRTPISLVQDGDGQWVTQSIRDAISELDNTLIDSSFEEFEEQAKLAKLETLEVLRTTLVAREKYEAEQAELERLRQAEIERQQREHEERIAREAAEKARIEAEQKAKAEADRIANEQREASEKLERERVAAEQATARLKAEKEAAELREQQLKQQADAQAKQAEIDRKNAVEAERQRIEREQAAKAEANRIAEEQRKANVEHMRAINCEAVKALMFAVPGVTEEMAKDIVRAIAKNSVPNVSIKY